MVAAMMTGVGVVTMLDTLCTSFPEFPLGPLGPEQHGPLGPDTPGGPLGPLVTGTLIMHRQTFRPQREQLISRFLITV
jgi:hypothetical protein